MSKKLLLLMIIFIVCYIYTKNKVFNENTLLIGSSLPLTGSIKSWGTSVSNGVNAYFEYANDNNLIKNKRLKFLVYDDKYEPELTLENTEKLIFEDNVFTLFGYVGTPTVKRVLPILYDEKVPLFSPFSGASFLRNNKNQEFINFRSSYSQEIKDMINYLDIGEKLKKVAVFYQNDEFGEEGYICLINLLKTKNLKLVAEGSYRRNTLSINHAFNEIKDAKPEVIFIIGAYKTNSLFIKKIKENENLKDVIFCNISFGDANSMVKELEDLGSNSENLIFSQVVPSYLDRNIPAVKEYQDVMHNYFPKEAFGFLSLEAFLSSKVLVNAISRIKGEITREKLIDMIKETPNDLLDGIPLEYKNSQLLNKVFLFEYKNNQFIEIKHEK
jgi:branched-chain amino acid transport system substrate-binding protein